MPRIRNIQLSLLSVLCLISCERRPLDILATSLTIEHKPDYRLQYEAPKSTPEHYRVNMYDLVTGDLIYRDFVPDGGGPVRSMPGDYLCFMCNLDEGHLILAGEEQTGSFHITGPDAGPAVKSTFQELQNRLISFLDARKETPNGTDGFDTNNLPFKDQRVMTLHDYFWAGQSEASIPHLTESEQHHVITVNTSSVPKQGYVRLENIKGTQYISSIQCFVTSLAGGINPVTGKLDKENVTERFLAGISDGAACGAFLYFGINDGEEPHFLCALITDTAGGQYLYVYSMDPIAEDGLIFVIDSGITVPEPSTEGGGGFSPDLRDWDIEIIDVPLGS